MVPDTIFIGVPVYRAGAFVAETIESLLAQDHGEFRIAISIDGADEQSESICRRYLSDSRVSMVVQPKRLGWVRNTAFLFAQAIREGAAFACIQPHDDLVHPDYLSSLIRTANQNPRASVVYSDIDCFGTSSGVISQAPSLAPSPYARMADMLLSHFDAVAYRGLTRLSALRQVPPINENGFGNFAVDTLWMTRLGRVGELVRVPQVLYRKRMHARNTHTGWFRWPIERKLEAWKLHCLDMLREALNAATQTAQRGRLLELTAIRLLARGPHISPYRAEILALDRVDQQKLLTEFLDRAKRLPADMAR